MGYMFIEGIYFMRKLIKRIFIVLLSIFLIISIIPYLVPVQSARVFSYNKEFLESEYADIV